MNYTRLIISLATTLAVGFIAGFATAKSIGTWYATLTKPWFNPPNWLFAPVWTLLYILMGIALYLIWQLPASSARNTAMIIFFVQLALNFLWSFIFFNMHQVGWALVDIIALLLAIVTCIFFFEPLSKAATWLMVPYVTWVGFATALNYSIWVLNK